MRLMILCEGETEEAILKDFLAPYCKSFDKVEVINPGGNAKLIGQYKILTETAIRADPTTHVFCLIDMYKAPFNYPKTVHQSAEPFLEQYAYIKRYMEEKIAPQFRQQFFAFPIMMEIETWLLADVEGLNNYFTPSQTEVLTSYPSPESIAHPAQELERVWRRFKNIEYGKKLRHGKTLFKHVLAKRVYEDNCPHFEAIINQLLELQGLSISRVKPKFEDPHLELYEQLAQYQNRHDEILETIVNASPHEIDKSLYADFEQIEAEIIKLNEQIRELHHIRK
jgi:Domain of unknown function (DUF4276)